MKKRKPVKKKSPQISQIFTKEVLIVSGLLLLALILRLVYLSHLKVNDPNFYQPAPGTDMLTYHNYAQQIVNGTYGKEPYYYGPLYYYFLALIYKIFGVDPYIARLSQMILGVLTSLLIYLIAKKVFNKPVALISLFISIFYGMFCIHEGVLLIEPLATFLNTLAIFLLLRIEDSPSYKNITLAGIAIGLSALCRTNILLFVPFLLIWFLKIQNPKSKIQNLKKFAFLCLVIALTISPATIRNYLVSGKFVLISTNGPVNLWIGNNPYARGEFDYPPSEYSDEVSKKVQEKGDRVYIEEVIRFIKGNPYSFLQLSLKKFLLFLSHFETANNLNYEEIKSYSWIFKIAFLSFGLIAPLALLGIFLSLRKWKKNFLLYLFVFSFILATISFFVLARYRIAIIPILIPFSGFVLYWWYEKVKKKKAKIFVLSIISLFFFIILVHSQFVIGRLYPIFHSESMVIKVGNRTIIRDDSGSWPSKDYFILSSPSDTIKKEFLIKEDPSRYTEAILFFIYQGLEPGNLLFDINSKIKCSIYLGPTNLLAISFIKLSSSLFNQGLNTIMVEGEKIKIAIFVDASYTFGRSYFLKDGQWKPLKKGEFMIWLELVE